MRVIVSRSIFSWDHRAGTKDKMTTREQTSRVDLFMMSAPERESIGDYTARSEMEWERKIVKLFQAAFGLCREWDGVRLVPARDVAS
jgi:hypothetical protein